MDKEAITITPNPFDALGGMETEEVAIERGEESMTEREEVETKTKGDSEPGRQGLDRSQTEKKVAAESRTEKSAQQIPTTMETSKENRKRERLESMLGKTGGAKQTNETEGMGGLQNRKPAHNLSQKGEGQSQQGSVSKDRKAEVQEIMLAKWEEAGK
ncbi:hypothetical protein R1sor_024377 [Riccia sorocarpa]|uniref:Uncharacterized protein n=1 Tax=Riccia sorocarpa TaxID=122646 RepID=A0ABD3GS78_9MARC